MNEKVYAVDVPYASIYTHWVEANSPEEAVKKAKEGKFLDVEETGEVTGKFLWRQAKASEDRHYYTIKRPRK